MYRFQDCTCCSILRERKLLIVVSDNISVWQSILHLHSVAVLEHPSEFAKLPCGIAAGMIASFITQPTDVVKTKLQTKAFTGNASTTTQVFVDIMKVIFCGLVLCLTVTTFV